MRVIGLLLCLGKETRSIGGSVAAGAFGVVMLIIFHARNQRHQQIAMAILISQKNRHMVFLYVWDLFSQQVFN